MAFYENQSAMFRERAEQQQKTADMYYAKAMQAKENGDEAGYNSNMKQAQHYYQAQKENEEKAVEHEGKTWK